MKWIVSLRAYGDFVIALNALTKSSENTVGLLAGSHLKELYETLSTPVNISFINVGAMVPAVFDFRKRGLLKAVFSAIKIIVEIRKNTSKSDIFLFPFLGARERLIFIGRRIAKIPIKPNIYQQYYDYFSIFFRIKRKKSELHTRILILPDSRLQAKNIKVDDINRLSILLAEQVELITVAIYLENKGIEASKIDSSVVFYKNFQELVGVIKAHNMVLSADSLPAHIAEFYSISVYVYNSKPNYYWLPHSALRKNSYGNLSEWGSLKAWLNEAK